MSHRSVCRWNIAGEFTQEFHLQMFPRDAQDLNIHVGSGIPKYTLGPNAPDISTTDPDEIKEIEEIGLQLDRIKDMQDHSRAEWKTKNICLSTESKQRNGKFADELPKLYEWLREKRRRGKVKLVLTLEPWPGKSSVVQKDNFCQSNTYNLQRDVRAHATQTLAGASTTKQVRPLLQFRIGIERSSQYFNMHYEVPMFLITSIGSLSFVCRTDVEQPAMDRLTISLVVMLTMVTLKFSPPPVIPAVSYPTILDAYQQFCFASLIAVVVLNGLCGQEWFTEKIDLIASLSCKSLHVV